MGFAIYSFPTLTVEENGETKHYNMEYSRVRDEVYAKYKVIMDTCLANPNAIVNTNTLEITEYESKHSL